MADKDENEGLELDEDGIQIQQYTAMVLVVLPPEDFDEQTLRQARSSLYNVHVGTRSVSSKYDDVITGRLQDEFMVDGTLKEAKLEDCVGVVFVGGEGGKLLAEDPDALRLAREAAEADKMIGAWGHSVGVLAKAGILKGHKVTGDPEICSLVRQGGGKFTGRQLERSGKIATSRDAAVALRFGKLLVQIVAI